MSDRAFAKRWRRRLATLIWQFVHGSREIRAVMPEVESARRCEGGHIGFKPGDGTYPLPKATPVRVRVPQREGPALRSLDLFRDTLSPSAL
ncbi:MAG TPA: hypothetical protein VG146_05085 [Verrucomicrobiae bacterium]|nr:hypothetical protein [Verrucomicrobiae bacterium]